MKPVYLIIPLAVFLTLCSCVQYHPEPLSPEKSLAAFEVRRLDDPGLRTYIETYLPPPPPPWPVKAWDLRTLTLAAFYYHPDLDLARARWRQARAATATAGEIPNPTLDVGPEYITNTQGQPPWALGFVLNFPIETAGRRGLRVEESKHLSRAAEWGVAETAWQVRSRLRASILELFHAKRLVALLERQSDLREKLLTVLDQRLASGMVAEPEVLQARVSRDRSLLDLQQAWKSLASTRAGLASALGLPEEALRGKNLSFVPLDSPPLSVLPQAPFLRRQALTGRADLLAELDRYAAAETALRLEVARQYPNLQLGPGYKWDQGENKWVLGLSLTIPLFNRNRGPIAEAEARRSEEAARFLASQAAVIGQFGQAMAALEGARKALAVTQTVLAGQQAREKGVEQQFSKGFVDRPALLDARLETLIAEQSSLRALVDAQKAFGALENVVQRPLGPETMEIPAPYRNPRTETRPNRGQSP
jgi:cobalt-zinc-cadmium efflux system outer membrane protein